MDERGLLSTELINHWRNRLLWSGPYLDRIAELGGARGDAASAASDRRVPGDRRGFGRARVSDGLDDGSLGGPALAADERADASTQPSLEASLRGGAGAEARSVDGFRRLPRPVFDRTPRSLRSMRR